MRRFLAIFAQRWFVSLLGVAALSVLIWFVGPMVEISDHAVLAGERTRQVAILVLFGLWLLNVVRKQVTIRLTNAQLVDELVGARKKEEPAGPADEEIALLKERLEGALGTLKKARLGNVAGRQYLYQLPWYVIIGPPGCGKTTALRNSGIRFPLAEEMGTADIRGVGGTRNCDWFFTEDAVLLDTAGRYATQDSDAGVDSAAWLGFLDLLKKYRRRRPINGVIVTVSVPELLDQGVSGRAHHARVIRQRLQELHEHFKIRFPVYVLLTKCDLLPGFVEFFDDLDSQECEQVWGVTFPEECIDNSKNVMQRLAPELESLDRQLHGQLLDRMQRETSANKRAQIFGFPQQFAALKPVVDEFLKDIFRSSRFEEELLPRGVYFGSGTQEGMPMDRLLGSLSESFGLARSSESEQHDTGKSFFITRLLRDVVFKESGLAGTNLRFERRRSVLQLGAYTALLLILAIGALAWYVSYSNNADYVDLVEREAQEAKGRVDELSVERTGLLDSLPALNAMRDIPGGYGERDRGFRIDLGLNLDQRPKLGSEAQEAYRRVLKAQFLPRILDYLESQLKKSGASFDERYETLKAYRMFAQHDRYQREFISQWLSYLWKDSFSFQMTDELANDAMGHLTALLDLIDEQGSGVGVQLDDRLIARVSRELSQVSIAQQAYSRIKRSPEMRKLPPFDLIATAGTEAPLVLTRSGGKALGEGLPGMFTRRGYGEFVKSMPGITKGLSSEQWVLGEYAPASRMGSAADVVTEVGQLYAGEYISTWRGLLAEIEIAEFSTIPRAVEIMNVLSNRATSPMVRLLRGIEKETSLALKIEALKGAPGKAGKAVDAVTKLISMLPGAEEKTEGGSSSARTPAAIVQREFDALNSQVRSIDGAPAPIERMLGLLNELWVASNTLQSAHGGELMTVARQQFTGTMARITLEAARQPEPISRWLRSIVESMRSVALGGVQTELNALWHSTGASVCRDTISGRYPIVRSAQEEIALNDFAQFFGPDGVMDAFFNKHLKEFVDTTTQPWQPRSFAGVGASIPSPTLEQFRRADVIRRTFFTGGVTTPFIAFDLYPITMSKDVAIFVLNLSGQVMAYQNDTDEPTGLRWPGDGPGKVSMQRTIDSGQTAFDSAAGPWAWFRMLDNAEVSATQVRERFKVVFTVGERFMEYHLKVDGPRDAFWLPELEHFQCPSRF